jgi:HAD superfamily hydrolase (TIGR01509 family)
VPQPKSQPDPIRAALFDLDGTLVRTFIDFPAMRAAMQSLSEKYGTADVTADEDDVLEIVRKIAAALGGERGEAARRTAYAEIEARERAGCASPEPIDGAAELLSQLRREQNLVIGIITRNCRAVAEELLTRMALEHDILVAREDVPEFKPHPAPVLFACRQLRVAPADCVMVGDLWADIAAGRAAGVRSTIGIQWPYDPPNRFARCPPEKIVSSLRETAAFLLDESIGLAAQRSLSAPEGL